MQSVYVGCMDTQRFSFASTAVAIRKAMALYQQNPKMSVRETQSRDLTYGLYTKCESLELNRIAVTKKLEVQEFLVVATASPAATTALCTNVC